MITSIVHTYTDHTTMTDTTSIAFLEQLYLFLELRKHFLRSDRAKIAIILQADPRNQRIQWLIISGKARLLVDSMSIRGSADISMFQGSLRTGSQALEATGVRDIYRGNALPRYSRTNALRLPRPYSCWSSSFPPIGEGSTGVTAFLASLRDRWTTSSLTPELQRMIRERRPLLRSGYRVASNLHASRTRH